MPAEDARIVSLEPGQSLGPYKVATLIGEGGMGGDVSLRSMNRSQESEGRSQEEAGAARLSPCLVIRFTCP